jgi:hypothetical protein
MPEAKRFNRICAKLPILKLIPLEKFGVNITRTRNLWKNSLFYPVIKAAAILGHNFPLLKNI